LIVFLSFWFFQLVFFEPVLSSKAEIPIGTGHDAAFLIVGRAAKPPKRGRIDGVEQAV